MTEPIARAADVVPLHPDADPNLEAWRDLRQRSVEMSMPHGAFYLLVILSSAIASFGLLANSTAVVIGAMLVAPLMGPIFGIAFGLTTGDSELLGHAVAAELKGVGIAVALALLIGLIPNHPEYGSEILGRTRPTVYDAIVALASGAAGAFALVDRRVSPALPGVAIATAIVPPLAAVGLSLAAGRLDWAGGAFLLFLTNLLAIELAAVAIFTWVGHRKGHLHEHFQLGYFLRHFGVSVIALIGICVFLTRTLLAGITVDRQRQAVRALLERETRSTQGAYVEALSLETRGDSLHVAATVITPQEFRPPQVAAMQAQLRESVSPTTQLVLRSVLVRSFDSEGAVFSPPEEARVPSAADRQAAMLATARRALRQRMATVAGLELEDVRREVVARGELWHAADSAADSLGRRTAGDSITVFTAVVRTPRAIEPAQVDSFERALVDAIGRPVRLVVRSVLTRDAVSDRFLYDSAPPPPAGRATSDRRAPARPSSRVPR
jgi:uncharacterized hydrophobic protein (TIGR00271 family)